jgi:serine/threonine protein kinase
MFKSKTLQGKTGKTYYIEKEIASRKATKHSMVVNDDGDSLFCISLDLKKTMVNKKNIEEFISKKNPMEEVQTPFSMRIYDKILLNGILHVIVNPFDSSLEDILTKKDQKLNIHIAKKFCVIFEEIYSRFKRFQSQKNQFCLSNIFISKGEILFGGWDLGEMGSELFFSNLGSFYYKAPELLEKTTTKNVDFEKCDIWSVGICLYALYNGSLLFSGVEREEVLSEIKNLSTTGSLFSIISDIDPEMKHTLNKMLCKNSKERLTLNELKQSRTLKSVDKRTDNASNQKLGSFEDNNKDSVFDRVARASFKVQIETNLAKSLAFNNGESLTTLVSSMKLSNLSHSESRQNTGSQFKLTSEDQIDSALLLYLFEKNVIIFIMDCAKKLIDCQSSKKMDSLEEIFQLLELIVVKKAFVQNYYITQIMQNKINIFNIDDFEKHLESVTYSDLLIFFRDFNDYTRQLFHKLKVEHLVAYAKNKEEIANIEQYDIEALNKKMGIYLNIIFKFYKKHKASMNNLERHLVMQLLVYLLYAKNSAERFEFERFSTTKDWVIFCSSLMNKSYVEIESVFDSSNL